MSDEIDRLFDEIGRDVVAVMGDMAARSVQNLKQKVSVPVVRIGSKVIRSKPGEHPRKDKGRLQKEITSDVVHIGEVVIASVESPTPYSKRLQEEMDRPITEGELEETESTWIDEVVAAIDGK